MKLNNNDDSHNSGLNLLIYNMLLDIESHPAWVCGLKPKVCYFQRFNLCHTLRGCVDWNQQLEIAFTTMLKSHPAWVCGLKLWVGQRQRLVQVTPCVGVWIETLITKDKYFYFSHTLRGCVDWNKQNNRNTGLKTGSHPAWVCGLKLYLPNVLRRQ